MISGAQYGSSLLELFTASYEPNTCPERRSRFGYVLRCRSCLVASSSDAEVPHVDGCPVGALITRWRQEGRTEGVIDAFNALLVHLHQADQRPPM